MFEDSAPEFIERVILLRHFAHTMGSMLINWVAFDQSVLNTAVLAVLSTGIRVAYIYISAVAIFRKSKKQRFDV